MSSSTNALQDAASIDEFLNVAAMESVPLFEYLSFEFLLEYDVFAPAIVAGWITQFHQDGVSELLTE